MINKNDTKEIARTTTDFLRTRMQHHSVDLSGTDYDTVHAHLVSLLASYEDNRMVQDTQLNPHTGVAEETKSAY